MMIATGTTSDLSDFYRFQTARHAAIELSHSSECDMLDFHVKPHADRVGRDHVVHFTSLVHFDLRIACTWGEGT